MLISTLARTRGLDDPFSLALTLHAWRSLRGTLDDVPLAVRNAEECMRVATEHSLPLPRAWSTGLMGWCVAENGERERGLAMLMTQLGRCERLNRSFSCPMSSDFWLTRAARPAVTRKP